MKCRSQGNFGRRDLLTDWEGVSTRTGAGSCTGAGPAGSSRAPPVAGVASVPPRTRSACHSVLTVGSWAEGRKRKIVNEKEIM